MYVKPKHSKYNSCHNNYYITVNICDMHFCYNKYTKNL